MAKHTLLAPHTHGDIEYKKGDQIEVTEQEADWLAQRGIIDQKPKPETTGE